MKPVVLSLIALVALTGCAQMNWPTAQKAPAPDTTPDPADVEPEPIPVPENARTAEEFDTTTAEERSEAAGQSAGQEVDLGLSVASLGAPGEPGFWLKTPLVSNPGKGRVLYPQTGRSVQVDLIPIDGPKTAGSRMSLAAMRLLDAPLAGLPEIRVYRSAN